MFIFPHGTWKDNIRSVVFDWRRRSDGRSSEEERSTGLSSEVGDPLATQANLSAPAPVYVLQPLQKIYMCELSLLLHSYFIQTTPSKNKNMNYIFIYLRFLRYLSSCSICDNIKKNVEYVSDVDTNCNWCSWYSHWRIIQGTRSLGKKRRVEDNQNYYIWQNT